MTYTTATMRYSEIEADVLMGSEKNHLRESRALLQHAQHHWGARHYEVAKAQRLVGLCLLKLGQTTQAKRQFEKAQAIFNLGRWTQTADAVLCRLDLARLKQLQGDTGASKRLLRQAARGARALLEHGNMELFRAMLVYADYIAPLAKADAVATAHQAIRLVESVYGADCLSICHNVERVADEVKGDVRFDRETLYRYAIARYERRFGRHYEGLSGLFEKLGDLYVARGNHRAAIAAYRRELQVRDGMLERRGYDEPPHIGRETVLESLASCYEKCGRIAQAVAMRQRLLDVFRFELGDDAPELVTPIHELAGLYRQQQRYAEAHALLKQALMIHKKHSNDFSFNAEATLHYHLGLVCEETGKYRRAMRRNLRAAKRHYEAALRWARHMPPDEAGLTADIADHLANVCSGLKESKRAMAFYYLALAIRKKRYGAQHPSVAATLNDLALVLHGREHYARAERALRHALAIAEAHYGPARSELKPILNNLAVTLAEQHRFDRAVPLLRRALSIPEGRRGDRNDRMLSPLWNLARMEALADRRPAALALYRRVLALQIRSAGRSCADTRQLEREQAAVLANRPLHGLPGYWLSESSLEWDPDAAPPSAEPSPAAPQEAKLPASSGR